MQRACSPVPERPIRAPLSLRYAMHALAVLLLQLAPGATPMPTPGSAAHSGLEWLVIASIVLPILLLYALVFAGRGRT